MYPKERQIAVLYAMRLVARLENSSYAVGHKNFPDQFRAD